MTRHLRRWVVVARQIDGDAYVPMAYARTYPGAKHWKKKLRRAWHDQLVFRIERNR